MKTIALLRAVAVLCGSIVALATSSKASAILHDFTGGVNDGRTPYGSLTLTNSKLYGMTLSGGTNATNALAGTLFSTNLDGTGFALLHRFGSIGDGNQPTGSLTLSGSTLYGMTSGGGSSGYGMLFQTNTDGSGYSPLHNFAGGAADGNAPLGSLTLSGSMLYGTTYYGGSSDNGTIFSMNTDGSGFGLLHSFTGSDGIHPMGSLTLVGSKLYGMTTGGGTGNFGVVFSTNTDGSGFTVLHSFDGSNGANPQGGSLMPIGSKLYGMTYGGGSADKGTLFNIDTNGTGFSVLHSFSGSATDGAGPEGSLTVFGSTLYGMTSQGGSNGLGTLFNMNVDGTGFALLESFGGALNGAVPYWGNDLIFSADGSTLYGMTSQGGAVNLGVIFSAPTGAPEPTAALLLAGAAFPLMLRRQRGR